MRQHLAKVYGCLGATTAFATVGAYAFMANIYRTDILGMLASIGLLLGLYMWRDDGKNFLARFGMLMTFGLITGTMTTTTPFPLYASTINNAIFV